MRTNSGTITKKLAAYIPPIDQTIAIPLLLLKQQYAIGIITNGSIENQSKKLEKASLNNIFTPTTIYISEQYQAPKPSSILFEQALNTLDIKANELLYVGNNPLHDIYAPQQLGIQTAWINHGRTWNKKFSPNFKYKNIQEVLYSLVAKRI